MSDKIRIAFNFDLSAKNELSDRADRMIQNKAPIQLNELERSIHFLRGVDSRANHVLSAFYMFLASDREGKNECIISGFPGAVFQGYLNQSSLISLALACRKVFDHGKNQALTGANFSKQDNLTLSRHAEYWSNLSHCPPEDALQALHLMSCFFRACSKHHSDLLEGESTLGKRIGLIKQYADRSAAHITLQDYSVGVLDLAHVVAAITLVGEIIRSFDRSDDPPDYYNVIDESAFNAALTIFPNGPNLRLFQNFDIRQQARLCWQWGEKEGMNMLEEQLPYAIGWY